VTPGTKQPLPGWAKAVFVALAVAVAFVLLAGVIGAAVYFRGGDGTTTTALVAVAHNRTDGQPELLTRLCPGRSVGSAEARDGGPTGAVVWSATAAGSPGLAIVPMSGDVPGYAITGDLQKVPGDHLLWIAVNDDRGAAIGVPIELRTEDLSDVDVLVGVNAEKTPRFQQRKEFVKQIEGC